MRSILIRNLVVALAASLAFVVSACDESESTPAPIAPGEDTHTPGEDTHTPGEETEPGNIAEVAASAGTFTTLLAAVEAAGLESVFTGDTDLTVFAPTDAAFAALLQDLDITAEELLANELLETILEYHVIAGAAVGSTEVATGPYTTAADLSVWIDTSDGVRINSATVTTADIEASNGVIHVIDRVLMPPSIAALATYSGQFPTLLAALEAADLVATFSGEGTYTVFAPTEEAFAAALTDLGLTAEELLASENLGAILSYHVLQSVVLSTDLADGDVTTLGGEDATVDASAPSIAGAPIVLTDVRATNGVIHAIGAVMLPPSLSEE